VALTRETEPGPKLTGVANTPAPTETPFCKPAGRVTPIKSSPGSGANVGFDAVGELVVSMGPLMPR
jgi:hypothetical protein